MKATLDGVLLDADKAGWSWIFGSRPHTRTVELELEKVNALMESATRHGSTLILDQSAEGLGVETVEKLTILGARASGSPHTRLLTFADRRWTWIYPTFRRSYNIRRKSGERRLIGEGLPRAAQQELDTIAFATWSLNNETRRWTGPEALLDVINEVTTFDDGDEVFAFVDQANISSLSLVDVEQLELAQRHADALDTAFSYFGFAIDIYIESSGDAVARHRLDDGEFGLVGAPPPVGGGTPLRTTTRDQVRAAGAGPPLVGDPLWTVQDRSMERPSGIRVYSARAVELRVDAVEGAAVDDTNERGRTPPRWEGVVQAPEDMTLSDGRKIVRGTWISFTDYVAFLATQPRLIKDQPAITLKIIREQFLGPVGLMAYAWPRIDVGGIWQRRIGAILGHFRLTLQLQKLWLDRIRNIRVYRVAIEDTVRGARGSSPIYVDHAVWQTARPLESLTENDPPAVHQIVRNLLANEAAGPGNIIGTPIGDLVPASAVLTLVDEDQGIVKINYLLDIEGKTMRVIRSALDPLSIPTDDFSKKNVHLNNGILRASHEVSTIVTVSMGAPNDKRQFHVEEVTPAQVAAFVPRVGDGKGPVMEILISSAVSQARFAWDDARDDEIYSAFAAGGQRDDDLGEALGIPINKSELRDVAIAEAARIYTSFVDHVEGTLATGFTPNIRPRGTASSVSVELGAGPFGGAVTRIDLPQEPPTRSFDSFLPTGTRKIVRKLVDP